MIMGDKLRDVTRLQVPFCTGREIVGSPAGYVALLGGIIGLDSDYAPGVDIPMPNLDITILDIVTMSEL